MTDPRREGSAGCTLQLISVLSSSAILFVFESVSCREVLWQGEKLGLLLVFSSILFPFGNTELIVKLVDFTADIRLHFL